jgi:hypothetical protein
VWLKDGVVIPGANANPLVLSDVQEPHSGIYSVVVSNDVGEATAAVSLVVQGPPKPPVITQAPANQTIRLGGALQLQVVAQGTTPLYYQWTLNNTPLPGETNASLAVAAATAQNAGAYAVTVWNVAGVAQLAHPAVVSMTDLQMFAGLIVIGPVGGQYELEYSDALAQPVVWQPWQTAILTNNIRVFLDLDSSAQAKRFYRAVLVP